jgi:hydroxyacyl-ACP dehydratase HTD2-like protein with hotdog domain
MSYRVPVEAGKIREFAMATRSSQPVYVGDDAIVTPTFLMTAKLFWASNDDGLDADAEAEADDGAGLGLDLQRVLHAEEEFVFHGPPPRAGQTLTVTNRLGDRWEKEGSRGGRLRFVVMVTEFRNEAGVLVAEERTTLVETGHAPTAEGAS